MSPTLFESSNQYTPDNLARHAVQLVQPAGKASFDPLTLFLIETILSSVLSLSIKYLIEWCVRRIHLDKLVNPGLAEQAMVRLAVGQAVRVARRTAPQWTDVVDVAALARQALYSLGRAMTAADLSHIKMSAGVAP